MTGFAFKRLMRKNGVTIRALAQEMNIFQTRVRDARTVGFQEGLEVDWVEAVQRVKDKKDLTLANERLRTTIDALVLTLERVEGHFANKVEDNHMIRVQIKNAIHYAQGMV